MTQGDHPTTLAPGGSNTLDALEALLALQDEDLAADQLVFKRQRLPERARLAELERGLAELADKERVLGTGRDHHLARQEELESEIAEATTRIETIEKTLRAGGAASYRDQTAMAAEVESLTNRRRQLEDQEIEVMEILEPMNAEAQRIEDARDEIVKESVTVNDALAFAEAELDEELAAAQQRRAPLVAAVPPELHSEYERLRSRLGGIGAARLARGTCAGCNLGLSATELDRIRRGGETAIFHCDQCGRILVPERRSAV